MKNSFKLKALCAALAVSAASAVSASPIYFDIGQDFTFGDTSGKVDSNPFYTGVKNELLYNYKSTTIVTDANGDGVGTGDKITTSIGLFTGNGGLSDNLVTGLSPVGVSDSSDNGYAIPKFAVPGYPNGLPTWFMSFSAASLTGDVVGVTSEGVVMVKYDFGGLIKVLLTLDRGTTYNNFMNLFVGAGGPSMLGTVLFGIPNFSGVDSGYNNLIHAANGVNCGGLTGLQSLMSCNPAATVNWVASQDTNVTLSDFKNNNDGTYTITSNHDGSLRFDIPEPSMLLLMGGALLGLGLSSRRRAKQD